MPTARSIAMQIADAVANELRRAPAGTFGLALAIERVPIAVLDLAALREPRLTITPATFGSQLLSRVTDKETHVVGAVLQQKVNSIEPDAVDPVLALADAVRHYMRRLTLAEFPKASIVGTSQDPVYDLEHLLQYQVVTCPIGLSYILAR